MKNTLTLTLEEKIAVNQYIQLCERWKNSYFWKPLGNASSRRRTEEQNTFHYTSLQLDLKFEMTCSCNNFYITKNIVITGKQTNLKALKNLLKKNTNEQLFQNNRVNQ